MNLGNFQTYTYLERRFHRYIYTEVPTKLPLIVILHLIIILTRNLPKEKYREK